MFPVQVLTAADKAKVVKQHETNTGQWRKRKRKATDIIDTILENWPKSKKSLYEEIGVETDEIAGVTLPKK